mmetsp:Transcript_69765/g.114276  ORF Transcript_69765/g.114276 Transcript_69765/m.114276 type:complete len:120 (+) Transcript_69765:394-753(+)
MVKTLLELKADPNSQTYSKQTPLYQTAACSRSGDNPKKGPVITKLLLGAKADPNLKDTSFGRTPLMYAARDGYVDIVKQLLAAGADTGIEDKDGMTAILHAEERDREKVVKLLQEAVAR